jgi:hypothetical protein
LLPELFSVKVKVLGGGFGLWLGDNIAILSMVKRAHLLFLTITPQRDDDETEVSHHSVICCQHQRLTMSIMFMIARPMT